MNYKSPALTIDLITFDPGLKADTPDTYAEAVASRVEQSWAEGADLVLLPEFTWMGLEPLVAKGHEQPIRAIAECFTKHLLPGLQTRLSRPAKTVVLGTVPTLLEEGRIVNRALIFNEGQPLHQDKLHLTPWENAFSPGDMLQLWEFGGFRIAVIICLDIEIPELSARLRGSGVDLILCPSATETVLGVERVNRCASARAVELGCYVGVSHLTGRADSELIDDNIGKAALYRPSQAVFQKQPRNEETQTVQSGSELLRVTLDRHPLDVMRRMKAETNPAHLGREMAGIERAIRVQSFASP